MVNVSKIFVKCDECNTEMECDLSYLPNVYLFRCKCGNKVKIQVIGKGNENERRENIEKKASEITDKLYTSYGSDTGILFGIPFHRKNSVKAIVKYVLQEMNDYDNKEK